MISKIKDTALLVIDVTNFCCTDFEANYNLSFDKIRKMVPKLKRFISKYKDKGGKVVYIKCLPWMKKYLPDNINELYKNPMCKYYSNDKAGNSEEFYKLEPDKDDFIVEKNTYDAFSSKKLNSILKKLDKKYLLITGVFGDGCVNATINGAFSKGHNLIILKDLIETTDIKIRQDLQKLLKQYTWPIMYGKTINSKDF
jgi:nicotinamidase-related amidase